MEPDRQDEGTEEWRMIAGNSPSEVASLAAEQLEKGLKGVDDVVVSDLAIRERTRGGNRGGQAQIDGRNAVNMRERNRWLAETSRPGTRLSRIPSTPVTVTLITDGLLEPRHPYSCSAHCLDGP